MHRTTRSCDPMSGRPEPRTFPFLFTGLLALTCLLSPAVSAGAVLAEEPPAAAEKDAGESQGTGAAKTATSQATPTPTPKPSPTPKITASPARKAEGPAKDATPAQTPEQPARFNDFDLEKFHRAAPQPVPEEEAAEEAGAVDASTAGAVPAPKPVKTPRPKPISKPALAAADADPLKPYREREAKEKFRQMQIETARQRIAKLQERLDYLNAKKNGLANPAPLLAGQTRGQGTPATPIQGPGKVAIGGFFPALPPPQTDEDRENDKKLKIKDLLEQIEQEMKAVQEEIETARDELASIEIRFAQETQTR